MRTSSSLSGRVALVTGANHGIGAAIACGLAARGADEVAETVVWLCADANHLVTGNVIRLR